MPTKFIECCPCEALEQKWGQKPKSLPQECHYSIRLEKTSNLNKKSNSVTVVTVSTFVHNIFFHTSN